MFNETAHGLGTNRSCIRELFEYGRSRAAIVGEENVFDYSLGNPSIPAPRAVDQAIRDIGRVIWKELRTALLCGIALAVVCFVKIWLIDRLLMGNDSITLLIDAVVCLALLVTVVFAKVVGGTLPLIAKALKLDPAVMASPFITTIVDALSLLVYFLFAKLLLKL